MTMLTLDDLARAIVAERTQAARKRRKAPYYILNLTHPALKELYEKYKAARGIPRHFPPGDIERTRFELSLLSAQTLEAIRAHCALQNQTKEKADKPRRDPPSEQYKSIE